MTFREKLEAYEKLEKVCPTCGKKFYKNYTKYTLTPFCCLSCATTYSSRVNREERNKKISMGVMKSEKHKAHRKQRAESYKKRIEKYNENPNRCKVCNSIIEYKNRNNQTCSTKCGAVLIGIKNTGNSNIGGHRDKGGRSKSGYYKGHFCGSTYELAYTIYNLDHDIPFERNTKGFPYEYKGKIHNYYPDYITPNGYVEIKGYWSELVDLKLSSVKEPIQILYEKDLQYAFDYVSKTYLNGRKTHFEELYDSKVDGFTYEYICDTCGKTFRTNLKRKKDAKKFCSRSCYHEYRKGK